MADTEMDFVHLARLALDGQLDDAAALTRRALTGILNRRPDLTDLAKPVLERATKGPLREAFHALPVDMETRLELLRRDLTTSLDVEPTWPTTVFNSLDAVVQERNRESELHEAGLAATRSMLFVGAPGVGKTLAARWLAQRLRRPLLTLDLAAVMSSFLGRTGNNIRVVLDYARSSPSVLLLDEFDAIAKRRDDPADIGELKRLVTVLLQAVDDWPRDGVLVAATNHPELLDPAVWRRFERVIEFPLPSEAEIFSIISRLILVDKDIEPQIRVLAAACHGRTFAEVTRLITTARRDALMREIPLKAALTELLHRVCRSALRPLRTRLARDLREHGYSQRQVSEITGVSRDTLRKHDKKGG